jgi:K+-transporting ATPase KdpF subunit
MSAPAVGSRRSKAMVENIILLVLSAALMAYLLFCLLRPEKF